MSTIAAVIGRIFLGLLFVVSGIGKLVAPAATEAMITGVGMPSGLAIPTGVIEVVGGLFLAFGILTRLTAIALAAFTLLATLLFHNRIDDPMQLTQALKNIAIAGGLLLVFAHSQVWWSYDSIRRARRGEVEIRRTEDRAVDEVREAELRAHEAELRAARAEGAIYGAEPPPRRRRWF